MEKIPEDQNIKPEGRGFDEMIEQKLRQHLELLKARAMKENPDDHSEYHVEEEPENASQTMTIAVSVGAEVVMKNRFFESLGHLTNCRKAMMMANTTSLAAEDFNALITAVSDLANCTKCICDYIELIQGKNGETGS